MTKKKQPLPPRKKRYTRTVRLQKAKQGASTYNGKNIIKGYAKWFGVDLPCAILN